jgi:hypothetical protein
VKRGWIRKPLPLRLAEQVLESADDHVQGLRVFASLGDDQVGVALAGGDVQEVHQTDGAEVLVLDGGDVALALDQVALDAAHQADVVVGVDEDAQIEGVAKLGDRE